MPIVTFVKNLVVLILSVLTRKREHLIVKTTAFKIRSKSNYVGDVTSTFGVSDELHIVYLIFTLPGKKVG